MKFALNIGQVTIANTAVIGESTITVDYSTEEIKHMYDQLVPLVKAVGEIAKGVMSAYRDEKDAQRAVHADHRAHEDKVWAREYAAKTMGQ